MSEMPYCSGWFILVGVLLTGNYALNLQPFGVTDIGSCPVTHGSSLCAGGKHMPELWLLGVQKSGSTALTNDLMKAGIRSTCERVEKAWYVKLFNLDPGPQECYSLAVSNLMDMAYPKLHSKSLTGAENMIWRAQLPKCPVHSRKILGEFSMTNWNPYAPPILRNFYCNGAHRSLTFMVMLRNPIQRMKSQWYYNNRSMAGIHYMGLYLPSIPDCVHCTHKTFQEDLLEFLDKFQNKRLDLMERFNGFYWSMYADIFESWFENFDAKQFIVIPDEFYKKENRSLVCYEVRKRIAGFDTDCNTFLGTNIKNHYYHSQVGGDLTQDAQATLDKVMRPENERLARLLAQAYTNGLSLVGYNGSGIPSMVQDYVETHW